MRTVRHAEFRQLRGTPAEGKEFEEEDAEDRKHAECEGPRLFGG